MAYDPKRAYNAVKVNRGGVRKKKVYTKDGAQARFIELLYEGYNINPALEVIGYSRKTYEGWRHNDKDFCAKVDQAKALRKVRDHNAGALEGVQRGERLDFVSWRKKYLNAETFWHQLQWVDMLEGREPRDLHPAQTYEPAKRNRLLVNCPPFHAKSMTLTIDYCTYRLCLDPSYRILIVSAGATLATDFLYGIKQRLTSPHFLELQKAYAPEGGWEATAESWTESRIIFGTDIRNSGDGASHEKDPNVQAIGMRSKIYGKRADLIILDDAVDGTNVNEYTKQMTWLRREVLSRIEAAGRALVIGTRVAPVDLYSELRKPENYANQKVPWTYLASPAILEEGASWEEHVTLWPYSDQPWLSESEDADECLCEDPTCAEGVEIDGKKLYRRWDGIHLEKGPRGDNNATEWALVYQQKSVSEDATFPEHAVQKATNGLRLCGRLEENRSGHPVTGMNGMYVIGGCDPSIKGFAGLVVMAVEKRTDKRYLLASVNLKAPTTKQLEDRMKQLSDTYSINEWRVEKTGLLQFFTQSVGLRTWFQTRGIRFTEHTTGKNKWDPAFGVSSMASLFGEFDRAEGSSEWREITPALIELPRANQEGMKSLVHQLITWTPELDPAKVPCDLVMALWFAETGAREHLGTGRSGNVVQFGRSNKFVSPRQRKTTLRVNVADFRTGY